MDLLGGSAFVGHRNHVHRLLRVGLGLAQVVEGAVAGDPVKPGPQVDLSVVGDHRLVGVDEDFLENVLGILCRTDHLAAETQQPRLIAVDDDVEGAGVSAPDQSDQLLVTLELEQGRFAGQKAASCCVAER